MTGPMLIRPLTRADHPLLHRWVTSPHAGFWQMGEATLADVHQEYDRIAADPGHAAFLGEVDNIPAFLVELYDPASSPLAGRYAHRPGDVGMHVLTAPADRPVPGFTDRVMASAVRWALAQRGAERVVVEPDERNARIRAKNRDAGFAELGPLRLPEKTAMLSVAGRADVAASRLGRLGAALSLRLPDPAPLLHTPSTRLERRPA